MAGRVAALAVETARLGPGLAGFELSTTVAWGSGPLHSATVASELTKSSFRFGSATIVCGELVMRLELELGTSFRRATPRLVHLDPLQGDVLQAPIGRESACCRRIILTKGNHMITPDLKRP